MPVVKINPPKSSPRPWRCFRTEKPTLYYAPVFSTSVEVFPVDGLSVLQLMGLLHVRGGVSRMSKPLTPAALVFSTSVEVFPIEELSALISVSLLHVRGGVSSTRAGAVFGKRSSPRPWRCFSSSSTCFAGFLVFSTSVEVFP